MDGTPLKPEFEDEQSTIVREPRASQRSNFFSSKLPLMGCLALASLVALALGVAAVYFFINKPSPNAPVNQSNVAENQANVSNVNQDAINKQMANLQQQQAEIDKQKQQLANEQRSLTNQNNKTPDNKAPANVSAPTVADPPTARITFHRGSIEETVTGTVVKKRSYVLRTLSGQTLSATIRSSGNCAEFSNGSNSQTYETEQGDSSLTIVNNCMTPTSFKMTVFIR